MYLHRFLEPTIQKVKTTFPAVVITGPRQAGKSTLLRHLFRDCPHTHLSLEDPNLRNLLMEDPLAYFEKKSFPVILDEIQYLPEILPFVKIMIDRDRTPGRWFITGSQQFPVMKNVSESLAGRAAVLALPPLGLKERKDIHSVEQFVFSGSYPELVVNKAVDTGVWYSSYLQTYLERDVRNLVQVGDLRDFEQLMRFLAARTAQELNYSSFSKDLGISVPTIKRWVSVLEASYIIFLLPCYFQNFGKRLIKSPKLYFYDVGLVNYLLNIPQADLVLRGPMAGAMFETAVVSEILKERVAQGTKPEMYYWRSHTGMEVDLILPDKGAYYPYQIKLSSTIKPLFYKNLEDWLELARPPMKKAYLITNCSQDLPMPAFVKNIYWKEL